MPTGAAFFTGNSSSTQSTFDLNSSGRPNENLGFENTTIKNETKSNENEVFVFYLLLLLLLLFF
jgi:hypothetical protein